MRQVMYPIVSLAPQLILCILLSISHMADALDMVGTRDSECIELPDKVVILEGDTVTLTCSLLCNLSGAIKFERTEKNGNNSSDFGNVIRLSATKSQLVISNISFEKDDYSKIICRAGNGVQSTTLINVLRRPLTPTLNRCVVYEWKTMDCFWVPSSRWQQIVTGDYKLHSSLTCHSNNNSSKSNCHSTSQQLIDNEDDNVTIISWSEVNLNEAVCMRFDVSLGFMENVTAESEETCLRPFDYVEPSAPVNVNHVTLNSTFVIIRWQMSVPAAIQVSLTYRVQLNGSDEDKQLTIAEIVTDANNISLPTLNPNSMHTVSVQVKPTSSGFWSRYSTPYEFLSPPTVPCRQPVVAPHVMNVHEDSILIFWKSVPRRHQCGNDFHYKITALQSDHQLSPSSIKVSGTETSALISLSWLRNMSSSSVAVIAYNDQGACTKDFTTVNVSRHTSYEDVSVRVSAERDGSTIQVYLFAKQADVSISSVTVYWCLHGEETPLTCANEISWNKTDVEKLASGEYVSRVRVDGNDNDQYRVGVAWNGIQWADCINKMDARMLPPIDFGVFAMASESSGGKLNVRWSEAGCNDASGRMSSFVIEYCVVNGNSQCIGDWNNVTVPATLKVGLNYNYQLNGLKHDTLYDVRVYSCCDKSNSSRSEIKRVKTASFGKPIDGNFVGILVACALLLVMIGLLATCFTRCLLKRFEKRMAFDVPIIVPDAAIISPISTDAACTSDSDSSDDENATITRQTYTGSAANTRFSRNSGYTEGIVQTPAVSDISTSPLLGAIFCDRQLSDDSSRTEYIEVFRNDGFTLTPIIDYPAVCLFPVPATADLNVYYVPHSLTSCLGTPTVNQIDTTTDGNVLSPIQPAFDCGSNSDSSYVCACIFSAFDDCVTTNISICKKTDKNGNCYGHVECIKNKPVVSSPITCRNPPLTLEDTDCNASTQSTDMQLSYVSLADLQRNSFWNSDTS